METWESSLDCLLALIGVLFSMELSSVPGLPFPSEALTTHVWTQESGGVLGVRGARREPGLLPCVAVALEPPPVESPLSHSEPVLYSICLLCIPFNKHPDISVLLECVLRCIWNHCLYLESLFSFSENHICLYWLVAFLWLSLTLWATCQLSSSKY